MFKKIGSIFLLLVLFSLGLYRTLNQLHSNGYGLFYLKTNGLSQELISKRHGDLIKGDIVSGKFHSKYANLGTISVRFTNHHRDSDDTLVFRIKEDNSPNWQYQAEYQTDQFLPGDLFPFGFPIFKDSVNKVYLFELESLRGVAGSGIFLDNQKPPFVAVSFFNRHELVRNKATLIDFFRKKAVNTFGTTQDLTAGLINFSPLFLYLFYLLSIRAGFFVVPPTIIACVLLDILVVPGSSSYFLISTGLLWCFSAFYFKYSDRITLIFTLFFISLSPFLWVLNFIDIAEKTANWAFLFFVIGVIQQIYQYKYPSKKYLESENFVKDSKHLYSSTRIKKFLTWTAIFSVTLFVLTALYKINNSLNIYYTFYPETSPTFGYSLYFTGTLVLATLPFFIYYLRNIFAKYAIYIIPLVFVFSQILGVCLANLTSFEHWPKIFSISPSTTSEAWVDILIRGKNFQNRPFVGKVYIDGVEQGEYVLSWADELVVVRTSPAITKSGNLCVVTYLQAKSNCLPFEYRFGQENKLK